MSSNPDGSGVRRVSTRRSVARVRWRMRSIPNIAGVFASPRDVTIQEPSGADGGRGRPRATEVARAALPAAVDASTAQPSPSFRRAHFPCPPIVHAEISSRREQAIAERGLKHRPRASVNARRARKCYRVVCFFTGKLGVRGHRVRHKFQ